MDAGRWRAHHSHVGLTEAGRRLLAGVKPAAIEIDESLEALGALRGRPSGLLCPARNQMQPKLRTFADAARALTRRHALF